MKYQKIKLLVLLIPGCLLLSLGLAACTQSSTQSNNTDLQITLQPAPGGMASAYQIVQLADGAGQPITDATVSLEGNMNHGGMAPVIGEAVTDEADGAADGRYQVPFAFNMLGDWIVTVSLTTRDGATVTQDIPVQVSDQSITITN